MYHESRKFDLSSDTEIDMLLVDLPLDLIKENIKFQITDPTMIEVNYLETVLDQIREIKNIHSENPDAMQNLSNICTDFFGFIINTIDDKFSLDIDMDFGNTDDVITAGTTLYNFLILRYKKNITKLLYHFITRNKKAIAEQFEAEYKKKDVTTNSLKKKIKNKEDVVIISNLPKIIEYILALELDPTDFVEYVCGPGNYEGSLIKSYIENNVISGDFVTPYLDMVKNENDFILDEVQTHIKLKLLNK